MSDATDYEMGDIFDEIGQRESDMLAEHRFVGKLLWQPELATEDLRALVQPELFFDRAVGRIYAGILNLDGFAPENGQLLDWIAAADIAGRRGKEALGYLRFVGSDISPVELTELGEVIADVGVRRIEAQGRSEIFTHGWQSKMGLLTWADRDAFVQAEYDYLVEDTIPERELTIIIGATQAGKSFLAFHLAMCMCRALPFFGRNILEPVPVIWCAFEGGRGARGRMLAYAKHHGIEQELMFAALTNPIDLWSKELNVEELIKECEGVIRTCFNGKRPGAVFIDTHNAATPGASEIDSEAVSKIRDRYKRLIAALGCAVIIIGHTNAMGKHRGNELLVNNVDTVLTVTKKMILKNRTPVQVRDDDRRDVRTVDLWKQREGETGHLFDFVLPAVETGVKNKFGKSRTSCVVVKPNWSAQAEAEANAATPQQTKVGLKLSKKDSLFFKVMFDQIGERGEPPPPALRLPTGTLVVHRKFVSEAYKKSYISDEDIEDQKAPKPNTIKSDWRRCHHSLRDAGLIGYSEPYFWWTGKPVMGMPKTQPQKMMFDDPPPVTDFPEDGRDLQ
jgi:hypothetical protein